MNTKGHTNQFAAASLRWSEQSMLHGFPCSFVGVDTEKYRSGRGKNAENDTEDKEGRGEFT